MLSLKVLELKQREVLSYDCKLCRKVFYKS
nr:MAG TPA_asm: Zinc-finger double domain protein [Caudoviricetes sp.]